MISQFATQDCVTLVVGVEIHVECICDVVWFRNGYDGGGDGVGGFAGRRGGHDAGEPGGGKGDVGVGG